MKIDDSGMPEEAYWKSLFDIPSIISWLHLESNEGPIVEFGCGYGTFTVPVAKQTKEIVHAFDIDPEMVRVAGRNARTANLQNVEFHCRDILDEGTGLSSHRAGTVLAFNILHSSQNRRLLAEASRILRPRGRIAIIHWRKDLPTPRGPKVESRPDEESILAAAKGLGLQTYRNAEVLQPFHWGMQLSAGEN